MTRGPTESPHDDPLAREIERLMAVDPSPEFPARVRRAVGTEGDMATASWTWRSLTLAAVLCIAVAGAFAAWRVADGSKPGLARSNEALRERVPAEKVALQSPSKEPVAERAATSAPLVSPGGLSNESGSATTERARRGSESDVSARVVRHAAAGATPATGSRPPDAFEQVLVSPAEHRGLQMLIASVRDRWLALGASGEEPAPLAIAPLTIEPLVPVVSEGEAE